ncbi:MAG: phosphatidylinositol kinase [Arcobacter sp.]|nr:phosphatidylinositol kinase [Arcobacter sp.]|tara:strand:- start:18279 stop:19556 length:1278 start_codon:yes stop_codon:yes gene_type:complete
MTKLKIYCDKNEVGFLGFNAKDEEFSFEYTDYWKKNGFELSPFMKFGTNIPSKVIRNFIENLLPEGQGREVLSSFHHISKSNIFAFIHIIGKETTGALTFSVEGTFLETSFREVPKSELAQRIRDRKNIPIELWDGNARLSVAGVQDKLPITIIDGKFGFGEGELASTHILKFEKETDNIVLNEFLSLKLASIAGLEVPNIEIIKLEEQEVLLVERFDRKNINDEKILRKHIIDGCQALNLSVSHKYERAFGSGDMKDYREGATFKKIFSLIDKCSSPILTKKSLITWICVNLCLGNSDAHGKNISFKIEKDKMSLTPFYDIVNINIYKGKYDTDFAMGIDDSFNYDELGSFDIIEFCKSLNINLKGFVKEFNKVSTEIRSSLNDDILVGFVSEDNIDFYEKYRIDVNSRTKKLSDVINYCLEYK